MSSALVWQVVRSHNCFIRKGLNHTTFSAEAGNLYNKHSYKYSGLANVKNIDVSCVDDAPVVSFGRVKTAKQPKKSKNVQKLKKPARKALASIGKQAGSYRADLKRATQARLAAVYKSLRVKKAATK